MWRIISTHTSELNVHWCHIEKYGEAITCHGLQPSHRVREKLHLSQARLVLLWRGTGFPCGSIEVDVKLTSFKTGDRVVRMA